MKVQRKHMLAAGVAVVAAGALAVSTGLGFADSTPTAQSVCSGSITFSAEGVPPPPPATSSRSGPGYG